jgi:hypothetical protein
MRPIVRASGLICILSHHYSIVKIKKLFWYPVAIVDDQLSVDTAPVLTATCPLFRDIPHSQIKHLEKAVICRKYGLCLGYLLQLTVESFYRIRGIDQLSKLLRELEISAEICSVIIPGL